MKPEPGKYYRTLNGERVGPCQPHDGTKEWPFDIPFAGGGFWYSENGESATGNSGFDIIAEWEDAVPLPMPPATLGDLTLRAHIALTVLPVVVQVCASDMTKPGETLERMFARKAFAIADAFEAEGRG